MTIQERLIADLKVAMREGDVTRREAIRLLRAAVLNEELELQKREFDARGTEQAASGTETESVPRRILNEDETIRVVERLVKRHRDSIEQFERGGRADLVAHEEAQLAILQSYLPARMTVDEIDLRIRAAIAESGATSRKDMAKVMQRLSTELRGKADMKDVSRMVQELLGT